MLELTDQNFSDHLAHSVLRRHLDY